jgi:hypothetical protein
MNAATYNELLVKIQQETEVTAEMHYCRAFKRLAKKVQELVTEENAASLLAGAKASGMMENEHYEVEVAKQGVSRMCGARIVLAMSVLKLVDYK